MKFVYDLDPNPDMVRYLYDRLQVDLRGQHLNGPNWFCVSVREDTTRHIVAALACEFKSPFDAHFTAAVDEPEAITRRLLRGIFQALFSKAARITALVEPSNRHAQDVTLRLGFIYEGFLRRGLDGNRDALVYGMLREDCKYLGVRAARKPEGDRQWSASPNRQTRTTLRPPNSRLM